MPSHWPLPSAPSASPGADLALATDADLRELGVAVGLHRKRLLTQLASLVEEGVPAHMLGGGAPPGGPSGAPLGGDQAEVEDATLEAAVAGAEDEASLCVICMNAPRCCTLPPPYLNAGSAHLLAALTHSSPTALSPAFDCLLVAVADVLLSCGHLCVCAACTSLLGTSCPLCRAPIEAVHKVFT